MILLRNDETFIQANTYVLADDDARVALVELGAHGAAGLEQMFLELTAADSRSVRDAALASSAA